MKRIPDVLIVGGGIIGLTSAYVLAKAGLTVEVLDRGAFGREASWAGAGIIPPGRYPELTTTPLDCLRAYSVSGFADFSAELKACTGIDNEYHVCRGYEFLEEADLDLTQLWQAERIPFERCSPADLQDVLPPVDRIPYLLPMGQVRNPVHLDALVVACRDLGVTLSPHTPFPGWNGIEAGRVLVTVGAWAGELLAPLGVQLPVKPVRGQIVLLHPGRRVLERIVIVGKHYLVPRLDGRVLIGSTEEPEVGFEKANTPEAVNELVGFARRLVPALGTATIEKTWCGLRPGSPDDMPFIGGVPGHPKVFAAVGHFRAGVQLSLGTARLIGDLFQQRPTAIPSAPYRLDRKPRYSMRPAFRS